MRNALAGCLLTAWVGVASAIDTYTPTTAAEKSALEIAKRWQVNSEIKPVPSPDGTIRFVYGIQQVVIVCAPMQICDVELQPGEQVSTNGVNIGDTRMQALPSESGRGASMVTHIVIKPLTDASIDTSLVVNTDRRTYHFRLRSHSKDFMPRVGFIYPEEAKSEWDAFAAYKEKLNEAKHLKDTKETIDDLDFSYTIEGDAPWKPLRVYNNGTKTVIQMPTAISQNEAPALLVVRKDGGLFNDEETQIVNYRLLGNRYIVDMLFDKAILIAGVGRNQDRITITKGE